MESTQNPSAQTSQHPEEEKSSHARTEGARMKAGAAHTIADQAAKIGGNLKFEKNPKYIEERKKIFDELWEAQCAKYKGKYSYGDKSV